MYTLFLPLSNQYIQLLLGVAREECVDLLHAPSFRGVQVLSSRALSVSSTSHLR
jgi:hypothetical protein